jgi:hypothetical protein
MQSKPCICGQTLWHGDRYCIGCGRPVSWQPSKSSKEAAKILKPSGKKKIR